MSLLDRIAPGWAARRAAARLRGEAYRQRLETLRESLSAFRDYNRTWNRGPTYDAAKKGRTEADWRSRMTAADADVEADATTVINRARDASRDDALGASIVDGWVRNVVGTGIHVRASAANAADDTPLTEWNVWTDWHWKRWAENPALCDVEGRKSFVDFQALVERESVVAGQAIVVMSYRPSAEGPGLQLQAIEPEQLDLALTRWDETGHDVIRGVEIDPYGRAVAYHVYIEGHPLTNYVGSRSGSVRLPVSRVLHVFRQDRVRQSSGMSRLAPSLRDMWHKKMYRQYTMIRARLEACLGAAVQSPEGVEETALRGVLDRGLSDGATQTTAGGSPEMTFEPGMVWNLPAGKTVQFHAPQTPGGMYEPFTRVQSKEIAAGAGLDYPTVTRDFSGNSFAGQRQGLLELWKATDPETRRIVDHFCRPVWERFVTLCVLEGRRGMARPVGWDDDIQRAYYLRADFQPPPKPWIDPANQGTAAKIGLELGLDTFKDLAAERQKRWSDLLEDKAEVIRYAKTLGLTLAFETPSTPSSSPAPPAPSDAPKKPSVPVLPTEPKPRGTPE